MIFIISGPPGSGKGTLCESILRDYPGMTHLSTGDLLRDEMRRRTPLGLKAKEAVEKGQLVSDEVVVGMVLEKLQSADVRRGGALLDGFPRTAAQAKALKGAGVRVAACVVLDVPDEVLMDRSAGRRLDPTTGTIYHLTHKPPPKDVLPRLIIRPDDVPEKQRFRISVYNKTKDGLLQAYQSELIRLNADQPIPLVYKAFLAKMKERRAASKL